MSTRSCIAIRRPAGHYDAIYCHSDGYLSYNGLLLMKHWHGRNAAPKLFMHGDMSSLGEVIGEKHNFDWRSERGLYTEERQAELARWCKFYGRDRGSTYGPMFGRFNTFAEIIPAYADAWTEFFYLWAGDTWWTDAGEGLATPLVPLLDALMADKAQAEADPDSNAFTLRRYEGWTPGQIGPDIYLPRRSARLGYGADDAPPANPLQPVAASMGRRRVRL